MIHLSIICFDIILMIARLDISRPGCYPYYQVFYFMLWPEHSELSMITKLRILPNSLDFLIPSISLSLKELSVILSF